MITFYAFVCHLKQLDSGFFAMRVHLIHLISNALKDTKITLIQQ